jgi:uncharacterized protein (UPF0333 family)
MRLKKFLKTESGQVSLEYFLLLLVTASLTILSVTALFPKVKDAGNELFDKAVERRK